MRRTIHFGDIEVRTDEAGDLDEIILGSGNLCVFHLEDMGDHWWLRLADLRGHQVDVRIGPKQTMCEPVWWPKGTRKPHWSVLHPGHAETAQEEPEP